MLNIKEFNKVVTCHIILFLYTELICLDCFFFFLMIRPPRRSTLFPSPTLFRSAPRHRAPPQEWGAAGSSIVSNRDSGRGRFDCRRAVAACARGRVDWLSAI